MPAFIRDLDDHQRMMLPAVADRLWSKVAPSDDGQHWLWQSSRSKGYPAFWFDGRYWPAHRLVYELRFGPIPLRHVIDHTCSNTLCVRHLEAVTNRVNLLRGRGWAGRHARATHCPQGHPYDDRNTVRVALGRSCRQCRLDYMHDYYRRQRTWEHQPPPFSGTDPRSTSFESNTALLAVGGAG